MLVKDIEFYYPGGKVPYPITVTNEWGHPIGIQYPDGTFTPCAPSKVGSRDSVGETVWDGALSNEFDNTKGRLLPVDGPPYYDSTRIFEYLATEKDDGTETTGTGSDEPREKKTNRQKRPAKAKRTKKATPVHPPRG